MKNPQNISNEDIYNRLVKLESEVRTLSSNAVASSKFSGMALGVSLFLSGVAMGVGKYFFSDDVGLGGFIAIVILSGTYIFVKSNNMRTKH